MTVAEPADQGAIRRPPAEHLALGGLVGQHVLALLGDISGGPPVHVAQVAQQVLDLPGRARRHRRVQAGPLGRLGQQGSVPPQCRDVLVDLAMAQRRSQ